MSSHHLFKVELLVGNKKFMIKPQVPSESDLLLDQVEVDFILPKPSVAVADVAAISPVTNKQEILKT